MKPKPKDFKLKIDFVLREFRDRINVRLKGEYCYIGSSANEAFQLRAYAAVTARGRELAVTVDVKSSNAGVLIGSDLCWDDGQLLAEGPVAIIGAEIEGHSGGTAWLAQFHRFLSIAMAAMVNHVERRTLSDD